MTKPGSRNGETGGRKGGPRRLRGFLAGAVAAAGVAGIAFLFLPRPAPSEERIPSDPDSIRRGERVYAAECASCHGVRLEGQADWQIRRPDGRLPAPPHDASGHTWHHPDAHLFDMTKFGVAAFAPPGYESDMPAFEDRLSDEEIWDVLAFIRSRWSERERSYQQRVDAAFRRQQSKQPSTP